MPFLDLDTGQTLEYRHLRCSPKYQHIWNQSYCNKLGRLCQGIGKDPSDKHACVDGANIFIIVDYSEIPVARHKEVTYTNVVCEYKPHKKDPNRTCITFGGNNICYPGDVGMPTGSLELAKLVINSVLSCHNAHFASFKTSNFYLNTPLDRYGYYEYVRSCTPV